MSGKRLIKRSHYPSDEVFIQVLQASYVGLTPDTKHILPHKLRRSYERALEREEKRISVEVTRRLEGRNRIRWELDSSWLADKSRIVRVSTSYRGP